MKYITTKTKWTASEQDTDIKNIGDDLKQIIAIVYKIVNRFLS